MGGYEIIYPYASLIAWILGSVFVGVVVMVASIVYLDHRMSNGHKHDTNNTYVEFSFCLGGICACAVFHVYATYQLWMALGTPFSPIHMILTILLVAAAGTIWWLYRQILCHGWWVARYLRQFPRQTA